MMNKKLIFLVGYTFMSCAHDSQNNLLLSVMNKLRDNNTQFVNFAFSDLLGTVKEVLLPVDSLEESLSQGITFDGSSIPGCSQITQSDMLLKPDLKTLTILPWTQKSGITIGRIICQIYETDNVIYDGDARALLQKVVAQAEQMGLGFNVGPELEFFFFRQEELAGKKGVFADYQKYFDAEYNIARLQDKANLFDLLKKSNISIEKLHHEVANGQHEMSIHYGDPISVGDQVLSAKYALRCLARDSGMHVTFMPKPIFGQNGSAMHIHYSVCDVLTRKNLFYDPNNTYGLSEIAEQFIAGNLAFIREFSAILNPTINSYKRLVPGYEAPIYVCWGTKNRSALIRIPMITSNHAQAMRAEIRCPDPLSNPYLAFAVILKTGLEGIKRKLQLPQEVKDNLYKLSLEEISARGIQALPSSLEEALILFEKSDIAKELFGKAHSEYVKLKKKECLDFKSAVTDWELERYY